MRHEFSGPWSIEVVNIVDGPIHVIYQPFFIEGSDSSDGSYGITNGSKVEGVSGSRWFVVVTDDLWHAQFFRPSAAYKVQEGLVVTLDFSHGVAPGYHTLMLVCTSLDPALNPSPPTGPLIQFIYSRKQLVDRQPDKKDKHRPPHKGHKR